MLSDMATSIEQWRIELVPMPKRSVGLQQHQALPRSPAREQAIADLLAAFDLLARRGEGALPWAAPFRDDPIAFLLDTVSDGANVWGPGGQLLYQNRAARELGVGLSSDVPVEEFSARGRRFERRCLRCRSSRGEYVLEIIREIRQA